MGGNNAQLSYWLKVNCTYFVHKDDHVTHLDSGRSKIPGILLRYLVWVYSGDFKRISGGGMEEVSGDGFCCLEKLLEDCLLCREKVSHEAF